MILGIGVLSAMALRVDYLVNPEHGLQLDVKTVSFITGVVLSVVRLISTFFWGWLFDRVNFLKLRIAVNAVFLVGILLLLHLAGYNADPDWKCLFWAWSRMGRNLLQSLRHETGEA